MELNLIWEYCILESDTSYLFKSAKFEDKYHYYEKFKLNQWKMIEKLPENCTSIDKRDVYNNLDHFIHWEYYGVAGIE